MSANLLGADHALGLRRVGHRDDHIVRLGQQMVQLVQSPKLIGELARIVGEEIDGDDAHVEGRRPLGQGTAKGPVADDAHGAAGQFDQRPAHLPHGIAAVLLLEDAVANAAGEGQDHGHGALGQAGPMGAACAGQDHVAGHQFGDIQIVVDAGTGRLDPLELLGGQEGLLADPAHVDVGIADHGGGLFAGRAMGEGQVGIARLQVGDGGFQPHRCCTDQNVHGLSSCVEMAVGLMIRP